MRTLIRNQDLKTLFAGAAFAVGMGLIVGAAMQPNLNVGDGPAGPQMMSGESARRGTADETSSTVYAAYPQTLPDYVIGSDWLKQPTQEAPVFEVAEAPPYEPAPYAEAASAPVAAVAPEAPAAPEAPIAQEQAELEDLSAATPS